ncbi:MAG: hypothetical protein ACRDMI_10395 [Streptosporangiaceae bacterium]
MNTGLAARAWHTLAAELTDQLGIPVTWSPLGFRIRGHDVASMEAVRAIAGGR